MKITTRQEGDITLLGVEGRIMFGDGEDEFRDAVTRGIEAGQLKLVMNMSEVPYVDSAGISQLVRTFVALNKRGGRMTMVCLTRRVRDLLTMTRLLTIMEAFDSEAEAIASFGPSPR
jgi:anti-sigma B factor antagonist